VVARRQLLALGFSARSVEHRVQVGRLHRVRRGVYAAGTPELTLRGHWMAAVLSCGDGAVLSHVSAGMLWGIVPVPKAIARRGPSSVPGVRIQVSVPGSSGRARADLELHRRPGLRDDEVTRRENVPVTRPALTLLDLAAVGHERLEAAVNEADKLSLIDPEALRTELERFAHHSGVVSLRALLDRRTFALTGSELERRFLPIARRAGLPRPETQVGVCGYRVDFFWPELGLVVETDGLTYHRTPFQQARDRERDQAHTAAGLTPLRFTHAQVRFEPERVEETLAAVVSRLMDRIDRAA
jgi:very-short-patch-repair endonuclease